MVLDRLLDVAERAVKTATRMGAHQSQASSFILDAALTRYANSQIHQNVAYRSGGVSIRVILQDGRMGEIEAFTLEEEGVEKAVEDALRIARASRPNLDFKGLPGPEPWSPLEGTFDEETSLCTPHDRVQMVREAIETAHARSPLVRAVAGNLSTDSAYYAVVNSLGVSAKASLTTAGMKTTVISELEGTEGFSTAESYSRRVGDIDPVQLAGEAAERSVGGVKPARVQPGEYEVVLSPLAVRVLFTYISSMGFSASSYQDGSSFVSYFTGQRVFDEKLNVKDDAFDPRTLYMLPIDGEGVPKRRMNLIAAGEAQLDGVCYDSLRAGRENKKSTGHSPPPIGRRLMNRPFPYNVIVEPGDSNLDEMIEETKYGLFITDLWYIRPVEPTRVVLTGLTRDGTFLIEDGELSKPVVNLRFTDSMLSALSEIPLLGEEVKTFTINAVPAMKLKKMRFVGVSAY